LSETAQEGGITDERIERMRARIGVPVELTPPFNTEAHPDTMRHYAVGLGDPNPLFCDPDYGRTTRWGSIIGAPLYLTTLARSLAGPMPAEVRQKSKGAFAGLGAYYGGSQWKLHVPVRPGDRLLAEEMLVDVRDHDSGTQGRRVVRADTRRVYVRESDGESVAEHRWWFFHLERRALQVGNPTDEGPADQGRAAGRDGTDVGGGQPPRYSLEEIEATETAILAEQPRGAVPRYAEDVRRGDQVGTILKGPMRISDVLAWRIGNGPGSQAWGAFRVMSQTRQRVPGFFSRNEWGGWDIVQRLHWEAAWARRVGRPRPFDEGPMREAWLAHAVTDWMGDDGWLESLTTKLSGFNYEGDLTKISGNVESVDALGRATVALVGTNQRGERTCSGTAVVRLPARSGSGSGDAHRPSAAAERQP
jgi:acyl dehydratase